MGLRSWWSREDPAPSVSAAAVGPATMVAGAGIPTTPLDAKLAAAQAARAGIVVATREQAMAHSVVNRSRDLYCGILAALPFTRIRDRAGTVDDLGPGWLATPDPTRTRGAFVRDVTDDLFFRGIAFAHVTSRDPDSGKPWSLEVMPWADTFPITGDVWRFFRRDPVTKMVLAEVTVARRDVIVFESPVSGVLEPGSAAVITIGAALDDAAARFASTETAAGILEDDPDRNEPMSYTDALALVANFQESRRVNTIAYLRGMKYHESTLDPSRLQLVEGRAYQDSAIARVCNVPNYAVGVGVPNDSMTYKTAATARFDLIDFGIGPIITCWEQTLSRDDVMPHGTTVVADLSGFLRTEQLAALAPTPAPAPTPTGVAA